MIGAFIFWSFINGRWCFVNSRKLKALEDDQKRYNALLDGLDVRMQKAEEITGSFHQLKELRDMNHKKLAS